VAIAQANSYDRQLVRQQVQALLDGLGGLGDVISPGDRVAIKPNLTGGTGATPLPGIPAVESFATHPEVVRALGEALRDAGAGQLFIVEGVYDGETYPAWGYQDVAGALGATLIDLNVPQPYPDFVSAQVGEGWFVYPDYAINPILTEIDVFVSAAKMKCHWSCGVTLSMKNQIGLPWIETMAPVGPGVLVAGKNPVATDAASAAVMGFDPTTNYPSAPFLRSDNHLSLADATGLGPHRLEDIEVVGAAIKDVRYAFKPA
jgi:uncharacterized protein (DUF362 family)